MLLSLLILKLKGLMSGFVLCFPFPYILSHVNVQAAG